MVSPTWMNMYCPVSATHAAALNGYGYVVDPAGGYYVYDDVNYVWTQMSGTYVGKYLSFITAANDGTLLGVNTDGTSYTYTALSAWAEIFVTAYSATQGAIGDINTFAVVDTAACITKSNLTLISNLATGPIKITATAGLAEIWGIDSVGGVKRYNSSTNTWTSISGKTLTQIHVSKSSSNTLQVFGVDTLGKGWSYDTATSTWTSVLVTAPGSKFLSLEGGAGYIWAVTTTGVVWRGYI